MGLAGVLAMLVLMTLDYTPLQLAALHLSRALRHHPAAGRRLLLPRLAQHPSLDPLRRPSTFQPSEIAKPVLILFLAWFLSTRLDQMRDWRHTLLRAAIMPVVFMLLIVKQPDLGTALVVAGVTAMMLLLAGMEWKYLALAVAAAAPRSPRCSSGCPGVARACSPFSIPTSTPRAPASTSTSRSSPSAPEASRAAATWRACRSSSTSPKRTPISSSPTSLKNSASSAPWPSSSSSPSSAYRGLRTAFRSTDPFARLTAFGITTAILLQAFFNISVVLSLLPTKGIPLPFISSGGTSLFFTLAGIGILLNISKKVD